MMIAIYLAIGFCFLVAGAEILVRGASRMAAALGMTPLVIGLTVVALGTSSPEFGISIKSALSGAGNLAVGNAVGSNTLNILLILGVSSLVIPLIVKPQVVKIDVPMMIMATVALLLVSLDGKISRLEGICFVVWLAIYIFLQVAVSRKQTRRERERLDKIAGVDSEIPEGKAALARHLVLVVVGLAVLAFGCQLFVMASVDLAKLVGLSELIIGLTVVSIGTSLPELVTCLVASYKGEREIAVGSIVGSNLFNILGVLGVTAIIAPGGFLEVPSPAIYVDIPVTLFAVLICLPIFFTGSVISRREGAVMLGLYIAYLAYLIWSSGSDLPLDAG